MYNLYTVFLGPLTEDMLTHSHDYNALSWSIQCRTAENAAEGSKENSIHCCFSYYHSRCSKWSYWLSALGKYSKEKRAANYITPLSQNGWECRIPLHYIRVVEKQTSKLLPGLLTSELLQGDIKLRMTQMKRQESRIGFYLQLASGRDARAMYNSRLWAIQIWE